MITGSDDTSQELQCDTCNESESFDTFTEAVAFKKDKSNGWKSKKGTDGEWVDICPNCLSVNCQPDLFLD